MEEFREDNFKEDSFIVAFSQGQSSALEKIIFFYKSELIYFAIYITKRAEIAEEIVNDSFLKIWERRNQFDSLNNLKSYLYKSVKNGCLDYIKSPKNNLNFVEHDERSDFPSEESIEAKIIYTEFLGILLREIDKLPEKQKNVFKMSFFDGFTVKEIAKELGITENAVSINKHAATKTLKMIFKDHFLLAFLLHFIKF